MAISREAVRRSEEPDNRPVMQMRKFGSTKNEGRALIIGVVMIVLAALAAVGGIATLAWG